MAQKDFLSDIDCPQFVDFEAGLAEQDDVFFESSIQEYCTPVSAVPRVSRRAVSTKFNNPTMPPLFDKKQRTASVRAIQMHPATSKPSTHAIKENLEKSPCVNLERRSPYEAPTERRARRRSQSESHLEGAVKKVGFCVPILRKRSLSADDVRVKRKVTCPITPLCLKRPKRAKEIKSTEQLELEKMAQLQKETSDRLRLNEMSMKRLALKKRAILASVELPAKTPCVFKAPEPPREEEKFNLHKRPSASNNLRKVDEEARSKFRKGKAATHCLAPPTLQKAIGTQKENRNLWSSSSTISCGSKSDAEKSSEFVPKKTESTSKRFDFLETSTLRKEVVARKESRNLLNLSTVSCSSKSDAEKSIDVIPKRTLGVINTGFHSGIKFSALLQKVKPFAIEKCKQGNSKAENEPCLPSTQNIPSTRNMKENVPLRLNADGDGQ